MQLLSVHLFLTAYFFSLTQNILGIYLMLQIFVVLFLKGFKNWWSKSRAMISFSFQDGGGKENLLLEE